MCVCACVCVTMKKKVPDEWQARQATPAMLQVSSSKHNAKKINTKFEKLLEIEKEIVREVALGG